MGFSQELSKSELESRKLFGESLNLLFEGNKYEARIKLNEAMSGEIYITDIPRLWYYAAKLDLQLGMIDKALQDLENALLFSTVNEEAKTLKNFIENMKNFSISNYSTPTFSNLTVTSGVKNSLEKFYNPVDVEILNSNLYILDSQNHLIYKTDISDEKWINLDKTIKYYSIEADKNLNRVYLGSDKGIYYFESYSPIILKEIDADLTKEGTYTTSEKENKIQSLIEGFPFIIYGIDSAGRIVGYDPYNNEIKVIGFNGQILQQKKFDNSIIFTDGVLWRNSLYLLEYSSSSIFHLDILKNEVIEKTKLPSNTYLSISCLPWNMLMLSSLEEGLQILNNSESEIELIKISEYTRDKKFDELKGRIKIKSGIMIITDYEDNEVILQRLNSQGKYDLYLLNLYGLNYSENERKVTAKLNVTDVSGDKMEFLSKNILVMDMGARVPFQYKRSFIIPDLYYYDINELFEIHIPQINTDSNIITHGEITFKLTPEKSIPFILSSSSLYYLTEENDVNKDIENLSYLSGGAIIDKKYENYLNEYLQSSYKVVDYFEYSLFPPIISGINSTTITLLLENNLLVDTLFYYTEGIDYEQR
jgi:hypothetical protein